MSEPIVLSQDEYDARIQAAFLRGRDTRISADAARIAVLEGLLREWTQTVFPSPCGCDLCQRTKAALGGSHG